MAVIRNKGNYISNDRFGFNGGVSRMASKIGTAVCRTARTVV